MKKVINCGQFFSAIDETVLKNISIVVENNKIIDIKPTAEIKCDSNCQVIDLKDKFVMPGLIDAHVHTTMSGAPDMSLMSTATIGDYTLWGLVNAQKDLMAGFTTLRDEGAFGFSDVSIKKAINSGLVWGPRMLVSGVAIGSTGGHCDSHYNPYITGQSSFGNIVDSPEAGRQAARYTFKYGADQIKIMATGGVMSFGDEPGAPELTFDEMKAILDVANSRGRISSAHAHGATGIKNAIKAGITSIEHGMLIDDEGIDMLAEYGTYLVPTIIAAYQIVEFGVQSGIPDYAVAKAKQCLENHGAGLKKMLKKGVKISFGTDAGTPFNKHGEQTLEFELMVKYGGFTPAQTLIAATRTNSELLRWTDKVGTLEAGKFADIVAFNESPLENIQVMKNCAFVMKDGVVYKA